jgi:transcriptional regulator with GAF, ATPase, and Fis domain
MSVRIERVVTGEDQVILHISERITADDVGMLDDLLRQEMRTVVVDLKDVDLVDREVVKFFALSESNRTDLRNCPAYVREWVAREGRDRCRRIPSESSSPGQHPRWLVRKFPTETVRRALGGNDWKEKTMSVSELIGSSLKFRAVIEDVSIVAQAACPVLIRGETGTGKEVIARAIHHSSGRQQHKFLAINCAAIPAPLLESELFGYERGAFTGALTNRMGRFQAADQGTLFLDEIGEMPIELQPKLLRALQQQEFEPLGSTRTTRVDVRIVAATNQGLEQMVSERRFRMDLYYRLNVFPITLPPLRERAQDVILLLNHFLRIFAQRHSKSIDRIPDDVIKAIERYSWPGNIRQLQNFIERSVILTRGRELRAPIEDLKEPEVSLGPRTLSEVDREHIMATLRETKWVVGGRNGAAVRLGLNRTTLIAKMQKLGISRKSERESRDESDFLSRGRPDGFSMVV